MKMSALIITLAVLSLAACGKNDTTGTSAPSPSQMTPVEPGPPAPPVPATPPATPAPQAAAPAPESAASATAPASPEAAPAPQVAAPETAAPAGEDTGAAAGGGALSMDDGKALAKKSGCFACHAVERKIIGPAWNDVSERYKGNAEAKDILVKWVHTGGTGRWKDPKTGQEMGMMPPYSPRVPDAEIDSLVDFILALKK